MIACGGTGGHLAPGIAIAEELRLRGHDCQLLISRKQVDALLIRKYDELEYLRVPGRAFQGGLMALPAAVVELVRGLLFCVGAVHREKPDAMIAFGGYLSVAAALAAWILGVPVVLHEANCRPGRATRLLRGIAARLYLPAETGLGKARAERVRHPGYPVRRDVRHSLKAEARKRLDISVPNKLLVVIGGSQGASVLNDWVVHAFERLARDGISVYCVTGPDKGAAGTIRESSASGEVVSATFVPFSDAMGDLLSAADLVISRAGAGSIAELIRCRVPSLLVPYPHAADDHQLANARAHERHGAGIVILQKELDGLLEEVRKLIFNDWMLSRFKTNLERLDRHEPAVEIARDLEALVSVPQPELAA